MCGLKLALILIDTDDRQVTPFVGVWIETYPLHRADSRALVTPFVGVWIETTLPLWITEDA